MSINGSLSLGALILSIGWSFGGVVAFEIGCLMMKEGFDVKGVVLVDAPCPTDRVTLPATLLDHIVTRGKPSRSEMETMGSVKEQFGRSSELLKRYSPSPDGPYPRVAFLRSREGMKIESESMLEEVPVWFTDREEPETTVRGWEMLLEGSLKRWNVPGDHFQPFLPENVSVDDTRPSRPHSLISGFLQVEATSQCIAEACRFLDSDGKKILSP